MATLFLSIALTNGGIVTTPSDTISKQGSVRSKAQHVRDLIRAHRQRQAELSRENRDCSV